MRCPMIKTAVYLFLLMSFLGCRSEALYEKVVEADEEKRLTGINILSPEKERSHHLGSTLSVKGSAFDARGVAGVRVFYEGPDAPEAFDAQGTSFWSLSLNLKKGLNRISAEYWNSQGQKRATPVKEVLYLWEKKGSLPYPQSYSRVVRHQDKLYAVGGKLSISDPNASNMIYVYPDQIEVGRLSRPQFYGHVLVHQNRLYSIGGFYTSMRVNCFAEVLDFNNGHWIFNESLSTQDSLLVGFFTWSFLSAYGMIGDRFYVMAGGSLASYDLIIEYNLNDHSYHQIRRKMSNNLKNSGFVVYDNKIWAFGGERGMEYDEGSGEAVPVDTIFVYDPAADNVSDYLNGPVLEPYVTRLSVARRDLSAVLVGSRVFLMGGVLADGSISDRIEVIDLALCDAVARTCPSPKIISSMPFPLHSFGAGELNGKIYTFGGIKEDGTVISDILEYDPAYDPMLND